MRIRVWSLVLGVVLIGSVSPLSPAAAALTTTTDVFPAAAGSLGAIPDGSGVCTSVLGTARDVTFDVSGLSGRVGDVRVSLAMTHTWVGDVVVELIGPGGSPSHTLFSRTGVTGATPCGDASDLAGPYTFKDGRAFDWWDAAGSAGIAEAIPSGSYSTSTPGPDSGGDATSITEAFDGADVENGTWTLRVRDGGQNDTGEVTGASLQLTTGSGPDLRSARGAPSLVQDPDTERWSIQGLRVANQGNRAAKVKKGTKLPVVRVYATFGDIADGDVLGQAKLKGIPADGDRDVSVKLAGSPPDSVVVVIDATDRIKELNENNNVETLILREPI